MASRPQLQRYWRGGAAAIAAISIASLLGETAKAATPSTLSASVTNASPEADDTCDGLFAVMDRPTVADSSCVVKPGHFLTELGYQNGPIKGSDTAHLAFYPQAALRYGLPNGWELRLFPPNYNMTNLRASAGGGHVDGFGDSAFGAKYQVGTFAGFTVAADAKVSVPTGNTAFSGGGVQGNVQGIVSTNLTPKLGVLVLLGTSSVANRVDAGRVARFGSVNASLVVGYQLAERVQLFSELFANTATASNTRGNLSYLGGVQLLLTKSIELDIEAGTLLTGPQGLQARFFGVGTGFTF